MTSLDRLIGAGKESRTLDLNLGKVALYQLSYSRENQNCNSYFSLVKHYFIVGSNFNPLGIGNLIVSVMPSICLT